MREVALLERAYRLALAIFHDSMRTFADGDCELARTLKLKDRELDAVTRDISEKLFARATVDSELLPSYVDLILVARVLERIGDHADPLCWFVIGGPAIILAIAALYFYSKARRLTKGEAKRKKVRPNRISEALIEKSVDGQRTSNLSCKVQSA